MVKRRSNNEGTICEDKERGGFRAALTLLDGRRIYKRFKDEELARAWLNEQLYMINKGKFVNPSGVTLGEWLTDWLDVYSRPNVRIRTFERYLTLAKHCAPLFSKRLQELAPSHFQRLYVSLEQYSGETRKKVHNLLNAALKQAVLDKLLQNNPMEGVTAPKVRREEVVTFTRDELQLILNEAKGHRWYPSLLLAATTGMRLGEVLGLRWQDVDFTEGCIHVRQTLQHSISGIIFEDPKTKASKRKISIPQQTKEALRQLRKDSLESRMENGIVSELCFIAQNGSPIQPKNYERWWAGIQRTANPEWKKLEEKKKALKRKGFSTDSKEYKDVVNKQADVAKVGHKKFHALRHTHATILLASGEPVIDVSRRLGHSKPSITLDVYGHAIPGHDQKIADKISGLYGL